SAAQLNNTQLPSDHSVLGNEEWCHTSPVLTACLVVCYCITMVLGLVGNTGLICIIARRRERANVTSIFICNLSFSDILMCVFCLPFTVIYTVMDHWVFGSVLCRLVPFIQCVSVTVSVLSLVFIALERHQLIINPSGWKPSIPQAYMAVILIWTLACFTSLPFLLSSALHQSHPNASLLAYTTWLLLFQYCGPLLLVLLCYIRVFVRLRHRKDMLDHTRTQDNQRMTHSRRINIMLAALITAFALCWLPLTIFNVVSDWNQEALPVCHHNLLFSLCHLLAMSSTCINPVIYGFLNTNFRQEVREALLHCCCRPLQEEYDHFPLSTVHMECNVKFNSVSVNVFH
uniref:G-protein coupled receptors family 1 profile domain-containing protein n=1 Tax=Myripristis murdjan TaxID=586833 RepID=A0A667Y7E5_9TELE